MLCLEDHEAIEDIVGLPPETLNTFSKNKHTEFTSIKHLIKTITNQLNQNAKNNMFKQKGQTYSQSDIKHKIVRKHSSITASSVWSLRSTTTAGDITALTVKLTSIAYSDSSGLDWLTSKSVHIFSER